MYCGDVANNRVGCISYKNQKTVAKPLVEWIIVSDMHEAIVSREDWQKCQDMREGKRIRSTATEGVAPLTSLLKCPDCGYNLSRSCCYYFLKSGERVPHYGYDCNTRRRKGTLACTSHYITERDLKELVVADIREKAGEVLQNENAARERFYAIKAQSSGTQLKHDKAALTKTNKRLSELDALIQAAFEKSVLGGDTSDIFTEYVRKYNAEKRELVQQVQQLEESINKHSRTEIDVDTFITLMKKYSDITELDRATTVELIDHITVSASSVVPREIVIYYNLVGNVE